MQNYKEYILHCSGIHCFSEWSEEQKFKCVSPIIKDNIIYLHTLFSNKLAIGINKNKKYNSKPFIAIQPKEATWFSMIQWDRIVLRERDLHLYFITKEILGDEQSFEKIPSFAVAISFDVIEKIELIKNISKIHGREYRLNEDNLISVNFNSYLFELPIYLKSYDEPILQKTEYVKTLYNKEKDLISKYKSNIPTFQGEIPKIEDKDHQSLLKMFLNKK